MSSKVIQAVAEFQSCGSAPVQEDSISFHSSRGVFVLADGFGGLTSGVDASRMACSEVRNFLEKEGGDLDATLPFVLKSYYSLVANVLFNSLIHANRKIIKRFEKANIHEKGGASVIAGFLDDHLLALAHVGSGTAWLMRGGVWTPLLTPRTYAWLLNPGQMDANRYFDAPLMALGMSEDLEPEIVELRVQREDLILIQSSGLRSKEREKMAELAHSEPYLKWQPLERVERMLGVLKAEGPYENNASGLIVHF